MKKAITGVLSRDLFGLVEMPAPVQKVHRIVAVDPGSESSGVVVLEDMEIVYNDEALPNMLVYQKIVEYSSNCILTVLVEDLSAYDTRLSMSLLQTAKFIGEMEYRLKSSVCVPEMIWRSEVRNWAFNTFRHDIFPMVLNKIAKKREKDKENDIENKKYQPTFVWVDDRMMMAAMKTLWNIPKGKGLRNKYKLKTHSWQALALASYFMFKNEARMEIQADNKSNFPLKTRKQVEYK